MKSQASPLLSIGIIFKNEIRCLERCLDSLSPLREMVPCEVVMADTGSDDGSRQIAEKYADVVFDFEWNNDFAAARNAVMDRCSGKWYMSIDCDEWLGGDISEVADFVKKDTTYDFAAFNIRNYKTLDLDKSDEYSDFIANRLLRMSTGLRFVGAIHERWPAETYGNLRLLLFQGCFFHHDGYVYVDEGTSKKKVERNMALLRKRLEDDPKDLMILLQCIESSEGTSEYSYYLERAVQGVEKKWTSWELFGPAILRYAAVTAFERKLPELSHYVERARELFPASMYTRIDVEFAAFGRCWEQNDYEECIQSGERYLKAIADFEAGNYDRTDTLYSTLLLWSPAWKLQVQIFMAAAYLYRKQSAKACEILRELDGGKMTVKHVKDCVRVYTHLHARSGENTAPLLQEFWNQIDQPTPVAERAGQRKEAFIQMASEVFLPSYWESEEEREEFHRHAYTLFLPLEGKCVLGDAAAILETEDIRTLEKKLGKVEDIDHLPIHALYHALEHGISFPLGNKALNLEKMDLLAGRLSQDKERLFALVKRETEGLSTEKVQRLAWIRGLALAAVRVFDWNSEGDGTALARAYARTEKIFLPVYYAPNILREDNLDILPPMHRFGWYCAHAFDALDAGDTTGYVRLLRKGLESNQGVRNMVEFLIDHTPEVQVTPPPSDELKALADKVRMVLANFSPDDPAVAALKQSEAYKTVAYLIEGINVPVVGGLLQ